MLIPRPVESPLIANEELELVSNTVERVVKASFAKHGGTRTGSEILRRFKICMALIGVLRGDLKWSLTRTLDHLEVYLGCELQGIAYTPASGPRAWGVKEGTDHEVA